MWVKRLLLKISLLVLISGATSQLVIENSLPVTLGYKDAYTSAPIRETKCNYIMFVPTVLQSGKTGQVCVFIDCEETVQLNVALEYQLTRTSIFSDQISSEFFECRDFSVPTVYTIQLVYLTFSAIGKTVNKMERKGVVIDNMPEVCFVQMEKKMYRPGDTVRFRLFCLDYNLKTTKENFTRICLMEPTGACVQILKPVSDHDVVSAEAVLSDDAASGYYNLKCERESGDPVFKGFSVERYMLPRFDSTVNCPSTLSVLQKSAQIEISAKYVYGKPLPGTIIGKCCRNVRYSYGRDKNCLRGLKEICANCTEELVDGSYNITMNLDKFKLQFSEYDSSIQCEFTIKEAGTGVLDTKSCYISISSQPANLQFDYNYPYYKHGVDYPFAVVLTDEKGQPMAYEIILIEVDGIAVKEITTDAQGRAECAIDTKTYFKPNITIRASYTNEDQCYSTNQVPRWSPYGYNSFDPGYPYTEILVYRFFSEVDSFLQIKQIQGELSCYKTHSIQVEYKVSEAALEKGVTSTTFYYLVKARGEIVSYGQQIINFDDSYEGFFTIDLLVTYKYASGAQVLVFGAIQTEIISDKLELNIGSCFNNQVSLTFTESVVAPGSEVQQELSAAPGSFCGIKAADASLDLLNPYDNFNSDSIYNSLRYYESSYRIQEFNLEDPDLPCEDPNTEVFCNGRYYRPVSSPTDGDTYSNFQSMNLIAASGLRVRKPQVCGMEAVNIPYYHSGPLYKAELFASADVVTGGVGTIETVRSNFDETFGWQVMIIGSDGKATAISIIPDTITEWNSDMFCISETEGIGLTNQTAKITTFLPVFVEVTTAQYCTRGEKVIIVTTVANYLDSCITVSITVTASDGSSLNALFDDAEICICKGERASKQWSVEYTSLGDINITASASTTHFSDTCGGPNDDSQPSRIDTVIEIINVVAEGIKREVTSSHLNIVKDSTIENDITIETPDNLVEDSYEIYLTVVGDTVGLMVENLYDLMKQPDGCCEQNLVRLLPIAYLLEYLSFLGILDDDLYEKAKSHLIVGYGRQLACRRYTGEYSVFRNSDDFNSWMNIKVFHAFEVIAKYVDVDTSVQQQTLLLVGKNQDLATGCFNASGSLFTIQDSGNNILLYTSYVVIRLLQSNSYGLSGSLIEGGLRCLQNADFSSLDTYTLAYVFHAAAVANLTIWDNLYNIVIERAITEGGTVYWRRENIHRGKPYYFLPNVYASAEIDITANIMSGILRGPGLSQEKIDYLGQVATWLSLCQNANGGYLSSQDTIAAIEAMTEYGKVIFVNDTDVEVVVKQGDNEVARLNVNKDNKMLVQRKLLPAEFGDYKIITRGKGNPLVQLTSKFNTKVTNEDSSFLLNVTTRAETCTEGVAPVIYTDICASYKGSQNQSNMVLIDIKELTGYSTDRSSTYQLTRTTVSEVVFDNNHVQIYLKSMTANVEVCFTITSYMDTRALLYQSSVVIIQDYYNAEESADAAYTYPCSPFSVE